MSGFFVALFVLFISLSVFISTDEYKNLWGHFIAEAVKFLWAGLFLHILFINMVKLPAYGHWLVFGVISVIAGMLISYILLKKSNSRILIFILLFGLLPFPNISGNRENLLIFIFICLICANKSADIYMGRRNFVNYAPAKFVTILLAAFGILKYAAFKYPGYLGFFYGMAVYFCLHNVFLNAKRISLWQGVWITTGFALGLCFY